MESLLLHNGPTMAQTSSLCLNTKSNCKTINESIYLQMDFMVMKYKLLCLATAQAHLTHSVFEQHV